MTHHSLVTLSNSSDTLLTPSTSHSGLDITVQNVHASAYVYVGADNVTSSNYGYRISPNHAISFSLSNHDDLYAVTDTNGSKVAVITVGLVY